MTALNIVGNKPRCFDCGVSTTLYHISELPVGVIFPDIGKHHRPREPRLAK